MMRLSILLVAMICGTVAFIWLLSIDWKIGCAVLIMILSNNVIINLDSDGKDN